MADKEIQEIIDKINSLSETIVNKVTLAINNKAKELDDYTIVWKQLHDIANNEIKLVLEENFPGCEITIAKKKSTYPDVKMEYKGGKFAIDIKSNEIQKNPWFDMARLDTVEEKRMNTYNEEWELVIKYDSETKKFLQAYFNLFREVAGIRQECKGVKYRLYDGKIRPKSWEDFDNNKIYWKTKKDFLVAIKNSQKNRFKILIKDTLIPILSEEEQKEFKELFK